MIIRPAALAALLLAAPCSVAAQSPAGAPAAGQPYAHERAPVALATRTDAPFVVDGKLDEPAWSMATPITDLRQTTPDPGAPASQKSEIRILYDDDNLYVGAWLFENRKRLRDRMIRRDGVLQDTDFLAIIFDSYHDHRIGYRFGTWPGGVQKDQIGRAHV